MSDEKIAIFDKFPGTELRYQFETCRGIFFMSRAELEQLAENIDVLLDDPAGLPQAETMFDYMTRPME